MKLKKHKIGKSTKWIIVLGALVIIGLGIGFKLFGFLIWPDLELRDSSSPNFSLDNKRAIYTIIKHPSGTYSVSYIEPYSSIPTSINAPIGSSKVNLEEFVDKKVIIIGTYRKNFGTPLIDIESLKIL